MANKSAYTFLIICFLTTMNKAAKIGDDFNAQIENLLMQKPYLTTFINQHNQVRNLQKKQSIKNSINALFGGFFLYKCWDYYCSINNKKTVWSHFLPRAFVTYAWCIQVALLLIPLFIIKKILFFCIQLDKNKKYETTIFKERKYE